jgi:hypothetical protein
MPCCAALHPITKRIITDDKAACSIHIKPRQQPCQKIVEAEFVSSRLSTTPRLLGNHVMACSTCYPMCYAVCLLLLNVEG